MSLSEASQSGSVTSVDSKTGVEFPIVMDGTRRRLVGIGVRKKTLFGLKNIDVYAFGVYADSDDVRKMKERNGGISVGDVLDEDVGITVRLQIVTGRLSIKSVRNAFEESVGNRLKKFSQSDNKELLQGFTSIFKDEYKIPRGTQIDLSREKGQLLRTKIDGNDVGCIQSKLLCRSLFDLYIGDDPFDAKAKEDVEVGIVSLLQD